VTATAAYEAGLGGAECWVYPGDGTRRLLPLNRWLADADHDDTRIVTATVAGLEPTGSVLDVGCGPGRLTAAVAATGVTCVGIDVSAAAVALTRARGARAVRADVFGSVPRSGQWDRVLLADGNLGIGGDPAALLARAAGLVVPGGRVVADVEPTGGVLRAQAWVEARVEAARDGSAGPERVGGSLPWAWVGLDAVPGLGRDCGLTVRSVTRRPGACVVVWERS